MANTRRIELYRDTAGKYRWRVRAANGRITDASEQGRRSKWYTRRKAAKLFPGLPILDQT